MSTLANTTTAILDRAPDLLRLRNAGAHASRDSAIRVDDARLRRLRPGESGLDSELTLQRDLGRDSRRLPPQRDACADLWEPSRGQAHGVVGEARDLIERLNLALETYIDRAVVEEAVRYLDELYLATTEHRT